MRLFINRNQSPFTLTNSPYVSNDYLKWLMSRSFHILGTAEWINYLFSVLQDGIATNILKAKIFSPRDYVLKNHILVQRIRKIKSYKHTVKK